MANNGQKMKIIEYRNSHVVQVHSMMKNILLIHPVQTTVTHRHVKQRGQSRREEIQVNFIIPNGKEKILHDIFCHVHVP